MVSPREYNFETDRIFAYINRSSVRELYHRVDGAVLADMIRVRHTSCSGFISFYPNDLDDWKAKPLKDWDHNELGTLLLAVMKQQGMEDWDAVLCTRMDEDIARAYSDCVDWKRLEWRADELREEKRVALEPGFVPTTPRCRYTIDMFDGNHRV
ncbi:hypothetical protein [Paraburkholderia fungorum]|uniref:hypothetical protein n=1 Tax=Paraburkholderia fungorum TaxID=134537 RepID=UPI0038BB79D8